MEPADVMAIVEDDGEPFCYTCISSGHWQECESCDDGWVERDDDDCYTDDVALEPCEWCNGRGGWWVCLGSERHDLDPGSMHRIPLEQRRQKEALTQ